jgi:NAD(P)-dependent dehydrogenase (short-subunit alcohol dehydrogenase family)
MSGRLSKKVAIVSGAGSVGSGVGNGRAAAIVYAREGAVVFATDLNQAALDETRAAIESEGGVCVTCVANATDSKSVAAYVDTCVSQFGRIDILHNNVGIVDIGGPEEITEANWSKLFDVNVKSIFLSCKHVLPHMVRQGAGSIINISSIASRRYAYACASYAASKGAVNQFTQNMAIQYARHGVRANCVLPGMIDTPHIRDQVTGAYGGDADEMIRVRNASCPTGEMGTPWDVAYASLFLASDEARYITGSELVVDGGLSCRI